jgi:hypothetical protein
MCLVIGQSPLRRQIDLTHPTLVPIPGYLICMSLILRMLRREREGDRIGERKTKRNKQIKKNEI